MQENYQGIYGYPLGAADLVVVERDSKELNAEPRAFAPGLHWPPNTHKIILFYPESMTPVCETELAELVYWQQHFATLGFMVYAACTDAPETIAEWFNSEEKLLNATYPILSSRMLPEKLQLTLQNGRAKRATVFLTAAGEVVKQEHFFRVGRSLVELHRMAYGYVNNELNANTWVEPKIKRGCDAK